MGRSPRFVALAAVLALVASACGAGPTPTPGAATPTPGGPTATPVAGGEITVMSLWGGSEQESFQKVLDAFKAKL